MSNWVKDGSTEHYLDAELYDFEYRNRRRDVRFYKEVAGKFAEKGQVLELACGSGRITKALLRGGHSVDALDISMPMLRRCKQNTSRLSKANAKRVHLFQADATAFCLQKKYPLIVMGFNSLEHLYTRLEVQACLQNVKRHLADDGRFVFDVQNPDLKWLTRNPNKRWARTRFTHPTTGQSLVYSTNHVYDPISQIVLITIYYDLPQADVDVGPETTPQENKKILLAQRKFFPAELEALLAANGFAIDQRYGDFDFQPLSGEAESQVVVCRRST